MTTHNRLREACAKIRTTPMPIADLVPLMQQAADDLDAQAREIDALRADAARIDFLQRGGDVSISIIVDAPGDGDFVVGHDLGSSGQGKTLREAIDNAIFEAGGRE